MHLIINNIIYIGRYESYLQTYTVSKDSVPLTKGLFNENDRYDHRKQQTEINHNRYDRILIFKK